MHARALSTRLKSWLGGGNDFCPLSSTETSPMLFGSPSDLHRVLSTYIRQLPLSAYPCFTPTTALQTCYRLFPPTPTAGDNTTMASAQPYECTIGELYRRAVEQNVVGPASTLPPLSVFAEQLLRLSPLFVDVPHCTPEQVRYWQSGDDNDGSGAAKKPLQDITVRWQRWVTEEVLTALLSPNSARRALSMETPSLRLPAFVPLEDDHHPQQQKEIHTWQALLSHVPTFYVPATLLQQYVEQHQAYSATYGSPEEKLEWSVLGQLPFAAALEWTANRSLVRLKPEAAFTTGSGVGCPEPVARTFFGKGNTHFMLLPAHVNWFHATLDLIARLVPSFFVPLSCVQERFSCVMKKDQRDPLLVQCVRERFPQVEALLTHPDLSFAMEMTEMTGDVPKIRLHPCFSHPRRGEADVFCHLALSAPRSLRPAKSPSRGRSTTTFYATQYYDTWEELCACFSAEEKVLLSVSAAEQGELTVLSLDESEGTSNTTHGTKTIHVWRSFSKKEQLVARISESQQSGTFPSVAVVITDDDVPAAAVLSSRNIGKTEKTAATLCMCDLPLLVQFAGYPLGTNIWNTSTCPPSLRHALGPLLMRREGLGLQEEQATMSCAATIAAHELLLGCGGDLTREIESLSALVCVQDHEQRQRQLHDRALTLRLERYLHLVCPWESALMGKEEKEEKEEKVEKEEVASEVEGASKETPQTDHFYSILSILRHPTRVYGAPLQRKEALLHELQQLYGPEVWRVPGANTTKLSVATVTTTTAQLPDRSSPSTVTTEESSLSTNLRDAHKKSDDGNGDHAAAVSEPVTDEARAPEEAEEQHLELPEFLLEELAAQHLELQQKKEETKKEEEVAVERKPLRSVPNKSPEEHAEPRVATKKIKRKTLGEMTAQVNSSATVGSTVNNDNLDDFLSELLSTKTSEAAPNASGAAPPPPPSPPSRQESSSLRFPGRATPSPLPSPPPPPPPSSSPSTPSSLFGMPTPPPTTTSSSGTLIFTPSAAMKQPLNDAPNLFASPSWGRGDFLPRSSFQEGKQALGSSPRRQSGFGQNSWRGNNREGRAQRPNRGQHGGGSSNSNNNNNNNRGGARYEEFPAPPKYSVSPCHQRPPSPIDTLASEVVQVSTDYMRNGISAGSVGGGGGKPNVYTTNATSTADALRQLLHTDAGRSLLRDLLEEK